MTDTTSPSSPPRRSRFSLDTWAVVAATLFVVLVVSGLVRAVPW
jgi:hypothetical protein